MGTYHFPSSGLFKQSITEILFSISELEPGSAKAGSRAESGEEPELLQNGNIF